MTDTVRVPRADPDMIWLEPSCCADPSHGRQWCEDNAFPVCEDGHEPVKYIRADLAASPQEAVPTKREAALAELAKLDGETMDLAASPQGEESPPAMSADHIGDAQGWRDIATAPRDGSLVLCFYPDRHDHGRYSLRYWSTGDWGVRSEGWSDQHRQLRGTEPTYWQPLPPPRSAHPAPINPSADTGELRERVAELAWRFRGNERLGGPWYPSAKPTDSPAMSDCFGFADAILDLIQSERGKG